MTFDIGLQLPGWDTATAMEIMDAMNTIMQTDEAANTTAAWNRLLASLP